MKFGYKMTDEYYVREYSLSTGFLDDLKKLDKFHHTFKNKKYKSQYLNMFKYRDVDFISFAVKNGYSICSKCMDIACVNMKLHTVIYLLDLGYTLSRSNLSALFLINKNNKTRSINDRIYTIKSTFMYDELMMVILKLV